MSVSHSVGGRLIHVIFLMRISILLSLYAPANSDLDTKKQLIKTKYVCNVNCNFLQFANSLHAFGKLKYKKKKKTHPFARVKESCCTKEDFMVPTTNLNPKSPHLCLVIIAANNYPY